MKQKDLALVLIAVIISGFLSFLLGRMLFVTPESRQMQAEVVDPITAGFESPNQRYFNQNSINPTQQIRIGDGNNVTPYNGQVQ